MSALTASGEQPARYDVANMGPLGSLYRDSNKGNNRDQGFKDTLGSPGVPKKKFIGTLGIPKKGSTGTLGTTKKGRIAT